MNGWAAIFGFAAASFSLTVFVAIGTPILAGLTLMNIGMALMNLTIYHAQRVRR